MYCIFNGLWALFINIHLYGFKMNYHFYINHETPEIILGTDEGHFKKRDERVSIPTAIDD